MTEKPEIVQHAISDGANGSIILNPDFFNDKGELALPDGISPLQWKRIHQDLTKGKLYIKRWHKASRNYGEEHFGTEFAAEWEAQLEFNLGLPNDAPKQETLNPSDKSRVFVSIEGINQQYVMWERKMGDEIQTWDGDKCKRALEFLEPMESMAAKLRNQLNK